jgi:hypothetical protein
MNLRSVFHQVGLHPLTALGMIVVDMMLFAPDATGAGWLISCIVAAVLVIPCLLLQRFAYGDSWWAAVAKAMMVGILTAIPTPLPSAITALGGVMGFIPQFSARGEGES